MICRKCGIPMVPGKATAQTFVAGHPDFPGDRYAVTYSAGGPGQLIDCQKCPRCGHSVTGDVQMRKIWKTSLDPHDWAIQTRRMPQGSVIRHVREQHMNVAIWFEADPKEIHVEHRHFQIIMTGGPVPLDGASYVGTAVFDEGDYVTHIYEVTAEHVRAESEIEAATALAAAEPEHASLEDA